MGKGFPKSLRTIEIEQQCRYGFTKEFVTAMLENWKSVKDYAWILQDKCKNKDGTNKEPHIHLMLRFWSPVPTDSILKKGILEDGTKVFGLEQLERIKKWNSAVAYLTHMNAPEKTQYDASEVVSNYEWKADAEKAISDKVRLQQIRQGIEDGIIHRYNIFEHINMDEYDKYKKHIDNFFAFRDILLLGKVDRNMEVAYIYGESGTGKTTYAKQVANDRGLSVFISSGGADFLDGYAGQECIILDDFRGSQAPLNVILKLLDNNTASSVPSRYRNKSISECKLIIVTSVVPIDAVFNEAFKDNPEPLKQFKRRCKICMEFHEDSIVTKFYNKDLDDYVIVSKTPNVVLDSIKESFKPENQYEYLASVLGGSSDLMRAVADELKKEDGIFTQVDSIEGEQIEF